MALAKDSAIFTHCLPIHEWEEVSEAVANIAGRKPWVGRELLIGLDQRRWFSSAKAVHELGYSITPFRETVRQTFEWYVQNGFL